MRTNLSKAACAASLLAMAGFGASSASANHVDFINDATAFTLTTTAITPSDSINQTGLDPAVTLGGERFVSIDSDLAVLSQAGKLAAETFITFGTVSVGNSTLTLDYGRTTPLGDGTSGLDFDTQWDFLAVEFLNATGAGQLSITVESGDFAGGTLTSGTATTAPVEAAGSYFVSFDDPGFAGVDFFNVTQVTVELSASTIGQFSIAGITRETVPEPTSLSLLGLDGLGLLRRRK